MAIEHVSCPPELIFKEIEDRWSGGEAPWKSKAVWGTAGSPIVTSSGRTECRVAAARRVGGRSGVGRLMSAVRGKKPVP